MSLVLKLAWIENHLDSLCQPCFRVSLASQHLCLSRQHQQQLSVTPAPAVIATPASVVVHRASACRVIRGTRVLVWKIEESIEARYQASLKWSRIQMENYIPRIRANKSWNEASAIYMAQGTLPELTVQLIISCDKTDGGCQGGDLPTAFDYVRNTAGGIDSDSHGPQAGNHEQASTRKRLESHSAQTTLCSDRLVRTTSE